MTKKLVIKLTVGDEDLEKVNMAFSVAAAAMATEIPVSFWLSGESVRLALKEDAPRVEIAHGSNVEEVLHSLASTGALNVCSPCLLRRQISADQLIAGARIAGATGFVGELEGEALPLIY